MILMASEDAIGRCQHASKGVKLRQRVLDGVNWRQNVKSDSGLALNPISTFVDKRNISGL